MIRMFYSVICRCGEGGGSFHVFVCDPGVRICFVFRRLMSVWHQGDLTVLQRNSGCRFHFSVVIPPSAGRYLDFLHQELMISLPY